MGSYVYGYGKREKTLPVLNEDKSITVGVVRYLGKPYTTNWSGENKYLDQKIDRYEKLNEGRELPVYVCIENTKEGAEVFDLSKRKTHEGISYKPHSTFYDEPYGFGPKIGEIVKVKGKQFFTKEYCD